MPAAVKKFIEAFSNLPSIGPRQATRLAYHLVALPRAEMIEIAKSLVELAKTKRCKKCFFLHDNLGEQCYFCEDASRDKDIIMIIERETDLMTIEKTGEYRGVYFIVGEMKKSGVLDPDKKIRLNILKEKITQELGGVAREIILAIAPTAYGDFNANLLRMELEPLTRKITRLGRGIPTGGEIEFADEATLICAMKNRG